MKNCIPKYEWVDSHIQINIFSVRRLLWADGSQQQPYLFLCLKATSPLTSVKMTQKVAFPFKHYNIIMQTNENKINAPFLPLFYMPGFGKRKI